MNCAEDAAWAAARALPALVFWFRMLMRPLTQTAGPFSFSSPSLCLWLCLLPAAAAPWPRLHARLLSPVTARLGQLKRSLIVFCADFPYLYTIHVAIFVLSRLSHPASANFHYAREPWLIYITIYKYGDAHRSVIRSHLNDCLPTRPE